MKVRVAVTAVLLAVFAALTGSAALNAYRSSVNLSQAVRLPDGKLLPAGLYDVEIEYRGFGNAAQIHFFKGKSPIATVPAEAHGFPSGPPSTGKVVSDEAPKERKAVNAAPAEGGVPVVDKSSASDKWPGAPAEQAFSWNAYGFKPGLGGKSAPAGQSMKISFDSSNSAAGFLTVLPAAPKGK